MNPLRMTYLYRADFHQLLPTLKLELSIVHGITADRNGAEGSMFGGHGRRVNESLPLPPCFIAQSRFMFCFGLHVRRPRSFPSAVSSRFSKGRPSACNISFVCIRCDLDRSRWRACVLAQPGKNVHLDRRLTKPEDSNLRFVDIWRQ